MFMLCKKNVTNVFFSQKCLRLKNIKPFLSHKLCETTSLTAWNLLGFQILSINHTHLTNELLMALYMDKYMTKIHQSKVLKKVIHESSSKSYFQPEDASVKKCLCSVLHNESMFYCNAMYYSNN